MSRPQPLPDSPAGEDNRQMNQNSVDFIKQNWELLLHPSAADFSPLIEQSVLRSVLLIVRLLDRDEWLTISEIVEATGLGEDTVTQVTSALKGQLFDKFPCPEGGKKTAIALEPGIKQRLHKARR